MQGVTVSLVPTSHSRAAACHSQAAEGYSPCGFTPPLEPPLSFLINDLSAHSLFEGSAQVHSGHALADTSLAIYPVTLILAGMGGHSDAATGHVVSGSARTG